MNGKDFAQGGASDGRGRILVVDDDPGVLRTLVRTLEGAGHAVEGASDGGSASALFAERKYDVIVSDIGMPGMDGLQLLRRVREHDLDVPVVLMTGSPSVETAIRAVEHGALHYLIKPFHGVVLLEIVARAIQLHKIAALKRQALAVVGEEGKQLGDRTALTTSLDRALGSLWMAFQPIVDCSRRLVHAYEALMRSNEPTLPHPPAVLEAAERLGRLHEVGRAVRAQVAAALRTCPAGLVFVNLHPRDLLDEALYAVEAPLSKVATRVVLELTERAALDDVGDPAARIAALRSMGYRIAVDDLGAGYAGLTSFAQLDPEVVKFDMSLVRDVHHNERKGRLIGSMAALFKEMKITIVAEGVECPEERDALAALGVDLQQGYQFARPSRDFSAADW